MRHLFLATCLLIMAQSAMGQQERDTINGEVTYMTSQNIYVKFSSTAGIQQGDTLFIQDNGQLTPALVVRYISSTSCVGVAINTFTFAKGAKILAKSRPQKKEPVPAQEVPKNITPEVVITPEQEEHEVPAKEEPKKHTATTSRVKGRLSAASYLNFSDHPDTDRQRMRYTFTFNANHIGHSGLSAETYISFRHTLNEWQEVKDNFKRTFKIYSLALQYDINEQTRIWVGRKINSNISNLGAIDGLQAEKSWKHFLVGAFGGSRPDHADYGFNFDLVQYGAYAGHTVTGRNGITQSTLAFAEQQNNGATDRRYAYFQHINSAIKRINIFTSFEFDLYTIENDQPKNTFHISSIYFSLRYRVSDKLSLFGSYDARKNIIYYETYKNFIDQLLEDETRQGFRFSFNYRPWKRITLGSSAGYRFQKGSPDPSENLNSYLTISRVPGIHAAATLSAVFIQSQYVNGVIYGIRTSRDLVKGKVYAELEYRTVRYRYAHVEEPIRQSIAGANLSWRFSKKLSFSIQYEGEIQNHQLNNRIYSNVVKRF